MPCKECAERRQKARDAFLAGKFKEALGHTVAGAVEMVGLKEKGKKESDKEPKQEPKQESPKD